MAKMIWQPPPYDRNKAWRGLLFLGLAGGSFYLSLDDITDKYRLLHGLSQVFVGIVRMVSVGPFFLSILAVSLTVVKHTGPSHAVLFCSTQRLRAGWTFNQPLQIFEGVTILTGSCCVGFTLLLS
jgi:hypothetical protein